MSEISGISNIENKNSYGLNAVKKGTGSDFSSYLGETKSLAEIFDAAAEKYNIPSNLLKAIGKAESDFNASAVSRCGAQGVMQLMPATAKELGVSNAFDAEQNIMGGAKYIAGLLEKYEGNTKLALAAYNAGSGNVKKYNGIPPFEETQNYVKKVMNYFGQGNIEIASGGNSQGSSQANLLLSRTAPVSTVPLQRNLTLILTGGTDSDNTSVSVEDLYSFFSYDDYMKFLDLFLEDRDGEVEKQETEDKDSGNNYFTTDINYSAPVMNLLSEQNLL
ncbi:MAG TPA: lytic transglycosylase domain-containing protein [Clostridiales bacterium]|nr:lytic transglycosylase domain-containing protein [Clostridiales bacterium]